MATLRFSFDSTTSTLSLGAISPVSYYLHINPSSHAVYVILFLVSFRGGEGGHCTELYGIFYCNRGSRTDRRVSSNVFWWVRIRTADVNVRRTTKKNLRKTRNGYSTQPGERSLALDKPTTWRDQTAYKRRQKALHLITPGEARHCSTCHGCCCILVFSFDQTF